MLLHEQFVELSDSQADVYCCVMSPAEQGWMLTVAQTLRNRLPDLRIRVHAGGGKLKSQFKKADSSGAAWALIVGADEAGASTVTVKRLRGERADNVQKTLSVEKLVEFLSESRPPEANID